MIKDLQKLADHVTNWTRDYAMRAGAKTLVLGLSGGIDSALCALIAQRTGLPLVCVNMPCHSSSSAYDRAKVFADEIGAQLLKVDLSIAHETITTQLAPQTDNAWTSRNFEWTSKGSAGGLRSCLRAPTLSFVAHASGGIIMGTGNRSEDRITRYYQKFGDGCVDFSPIADLWKSEVRELFKYLAEEQQLDPSNYAHPEMGPGARAIYDAVPTADLWGPDGGQEDEKEMGLSYDEVEWGDRQDIRFGIVFADSTPNTHRAWNTFSPRQQRILDSLWSAEKLSRHKMNPNLPVCEVRGTGFVE